MRGSSHSRRILQRFRQITISAVGSVKINLLLVFCIAFTLIVIASSFVEWQHHSIVGRSSDPRKGYTILINTWKRNDLLKQSIVHYKSCSCVDSIHIVWSEPDPPSDSLLGFLWKAVHPNSKDGKQIDLKFDLNKEDSLNNRFKEIKDLKTDAIFSIDDDVVFPCSTVEFAFSIWQSAPHTMVGFVPRMHWVDKLKGNGEPYTYGGWWSVWWMGTYSMVLSKAAFFHKRYLDLYTNQMPASIREYVTKNRNCEDIAMAFLVANASGSPPIWVKAYKQPSSILDVFSLHYTLRKPYCRMLRHISSWMCDWHASLLDFADLTQGKIFEIGSTGISSLGGHSERRSQCVNRFAAAYGHMPLVSTSVKAIDSRHIWFW